MYLLHYGRRFLQDQPALILQQQRLFRASSVLIARHSNHYCKDSLKFHQRNIETLGIKSNSSEKDIKQAYFKLAKKYHPDLNPNPDARHKFEMITKAYEILSDETKRETYDSQMGFGRSAFHDMHNAGQGTRGKAAYSDDEYEHVKTDRRTKPFRSQEEQWAHDVNAARQFWRDIETKEKEKEEMKYKQDFAKKMWDEFDEFFQFGDNVEATRDDTKGADYKADIEIDFMDAIKGGPQKIEMNKRVICSSCHGTRAKQGSQPRKCYECGGKGAVIGNYGIKKKCKKCNGAGCIVRQPCHDCDGLGVTRSNTQDIVDLPQGLSDGQKLKIKGHGHASDIFQGVPGDLLLTVKVKDHPIFKRDGSNIMSDITLSLSEALLGCKLTVDTIDGKINVNLNPGINDGDELILRHLGVPQFSADVNTNQEQPRGDHILRFKVKIPSNLTTRQKELLKQFSDLEAANQDKFYESLKKEFIEKEIQKQKQMDKQQQNASSNNDQSSSKSKESKEGKGLFDKIKGIFS